MTVLLLDPRWPSLIPMEAQGKVSNPVSYTGEIPVKVRWNFGDHVERVDYTGNGTLVSTNAEDPEVKRRLAAGEELIEAESRHDLVYQAQQVMHRARSLGEWEMTQTHASLLPYLLEEAQELADAIRAGAPDTELRAELGDVLLQVLFHAEIASRLGAFDFGDVAGSFVEKMRRRAPYLFDGTTEMVSIDEQERLWAQGKQNSTS